MMRLTRYLRRMNETGRLVSTWIVIFALLSLMKFVVAIFGKQLATLQLFTLTDALISAAPIFIWLVVKFPWDKISIGPLTFERRMRRRIEDQLDPRSILPVRVVELTIKNKEKIGKSTTKAVNVTVGEESDNDRYDDLLWFVGSNNAEENINWRHVDYLSFSDADGRLIGTMGPGRFRRKLVKEQKEFLDALRTNEATEFLDAGDEVHVKATWAKSKVLKVFADHPLSWFPVVDDSNRLVGIIEPYRLAITLVADIAAALSDN